MALDDDVWAEPAARVEGPPGTWPIRSLTSVLVVCQWLLIAFHLLAVGLEFATYQLNPLALVDLNTVEPDDAAGALAASYWLAAFVLVALQLAFVPVWWWWHVRAAHNQQALGTSLQYSPGMHAAGWVIPIASLYIPYWAMSELHTAATGTPARSYGVWWAAYLGGSLLSNVASRAADNSATLELSVYLELAGAVLLIASRWMYVRMVREIARGQTVG